MEIVEAEPLFAERAAGIDIGKAGVAAAVRLPGPGGRRMQEVRESGTTRAELEELADWLDSHQVTRVGMESTGDYWKPVFFTLERRGFECLLYNSRQVKAQPGRPKTARPMRCGWRGSPRTGGCGPVSCRLRRSGCCASTPGTGAS